MKGWKSKIIHFWIESCLCQFGINNISKDATSSLSQTVITGCLNCSVKDLSVQEAKMAAISSDKSNNCQ